MRKIILLLLCLFLLLFPTPYSLNPTFAQSCTTDGSRATGLISAPQTAAGSKFGTSSGACIIDPKAAFAPYKIPSFDDLKSLYYDQAKQSTGVTKHSPLIGDKNHGDIPMTTGNDHLYYIKKTSPTSLDGNLNLNSNIPGNQTGVVFVEGNLNIDPIPSNQLNYGNNNSGLVFIVKGNVNIYQIITQIDAVIIAEGIICTAYDGISCPATNVTAQQLVINGSLISIAQDPDPTNPDPAAHRCPTFCPLRFRRNLADNSLAAERINNQVKYLVILRNLLSDTFQRWSEIP